uniref:non-specific serine/threonine protein kinase n=2 Tax=Elaeis guineensis var. tenera TaxID=51953 RepID=A0A8N4IBE0_ELAGV|nr:probable LRR receptor-like serine/threonine-protein kinase At1g53440 [Elaeis guineensis]
MIITVKALRLIAYKLKKEWDFSVDPCSGRQGWLDATSFGITSNVTCQCNTNICHVTSIQLKTQNLTGVLPDEFANLTFLSELDLTRNYLSGSIPAAWASLPLTLLSLLGNQISGSIPEELGRITTLQFLILQDNQLNGSIPSALGNLINLNELFLSSNNLTGELPESLGNLKNLTRFIIDGNPISGKIPSFMGNWTKLQWLYIQGTSMEGPFPPIFSTMVSLKELRVSDLKGGDGKFPPLQNMKNLEFLVLRNLSISGELPDFFREMPNLGHLDLSFNNLSGPISSSGDGLRTISYMYLTSNMLNGTLPDWILSSTKNLDLSYNSFTGPLNIPSCQINSVNLVSSYSSTTNNLILSCLRRNLLCAEEARNDAVFINCGGSKVTVDNNEYEADTLEFGPSNFAVSDSGKWAYSSTGDFMWGSQAKYIVRNASVLNVTNPKLYMTARVNPLSLKYYGLCLQKGHYTVNLHFAEIIYTDDQTYSSVGKRLFDVSIQGQKVLQDFDIAKEANGTGKEIIKSFPSMVDGTIEIHFQWAGKGTTTVPQFGVYGPLISAISVTPSIMPDAKETKLSVRAILGIVVACCVIIALMFILIWFCFIRKKVKNNELCGLELRTSYWSLKQIKDATNNFDPINKLGEGGFGPVYKGVLQDGSVIAVKQLSSMSKQGNREFINEIGMISALQHPNLVKLYGCCIEGKELLLIYEYMENNNLALALFGSDEYQLKLDWRTRCKVCLGVARGLTYLHEESRLKIVHRDIKGTNILLDKDLNAKISDFGLARLDEEENTHISTRIAGTMGYMAPEYATRGYLTDKADVYSFGVVTLEIVSGMSNRSYKPNNNFVHLLDWALYLQEQGNLLEIVDPRLGSNYSKEEALQMLNVALICTDPSPFQRPKISNVVNMLEGKMPVWVPSAKSAVLEREDLRFKSSKKISIERQPQCILKDDQWVDNPASVPSRKEEPSPNSPSNKLLSNCIE